MGSAHIVGDSTASRMLFIRDRVTAAHNLRNCSSLIFAHRNPASCPQLTNPTAQPANSALCAHTLGGRGLRRAPDGKWAASSNRVVLRPPELRWGWSITEAVRVPRPCDTRPLRRWPPSESRDYTPPARDLTSCEREECMAERGVAQGTKRIFIIVGPGCIRRNPG
jgi:hypothetical protein